MHRTLTICLLLLVGSAEAQISRQMPFFVKKRQATFTDGMLLWAKPESLATNAPASTIASPAAFDGWLDSSGNGNHITNATSGERATLLVSELNGYNAAQFDGTDNVMYVPPIAVGLNYTIAIVFKIDADFAEKPLLWDGGTTFHASADSVNDKMLCSDVAGGAYISTDIGTFGTSYQSCVWVSTAGVVAMHYNGGASVTDAGGVSMSNGDPINTVAAMDNAGTINGATPKIVEIVVWNHPLVVATELAHFNTYITAKFGL